jgi:hypothetical protein
MGFVARRRDRPSETSFATIKLQDSAGDVINPALKEHTGTLVGVAKVTLHNVSITGGTNILASDISPDAAPSLFRIFVAVDTAGVFSVRISRGAVTVDVTLNSGGNLVAGAAYMFDVLVHSGDSVNFQYSVSGTLLVLRVEECVAGTQ